MRNVALIYLDIRPPSVLTVQSDLALGLPQGVLADTLVGSVVPGIDGLDGQPGVESVALHLLLGVVALGPEDHHLLEHPVGDGLRLSCYKRREERGERREDWGEILMSLVVIRDTDQLDTNARIICSSYNVTECHRMSKIITPTTL